MKAWLVLALCLLPRVTCAQPVPVQPVADWASYGTAAVSPTIAVVKAWRSPRRGCRLAQIVISEVVGNVAAFSLQHWIVSPRPCLGCAPNGMPSAHVMNSAIGISRSMNVGGAFAMWTAVLRPLAHRHTVEQVVAGAALGVGAEAAGRLLRCPDKDKP